MNIYKERRNLILNPFLFNTGKKLKCGIIGLLIPYKLNKCCLNGKIASIIKVLHLHQEWMIFQDPTVVKAMLIYKAGFTSFLDLCLKPHQVMDKVLLLICKTFKKSNNSFIDSKILQIMYWKILMKMVNFHNTSDILLFFQ